MFLNLVHVFPFILDFIFSAALLVYSFFYAENLTKYIWQYVCTMCRYATASARSDGMFLLCGGRDSTGAVCCFCFWVVVLSTTSLPLAQWWYSWTPLIHSVSFSLCIYVLFMPCFIKSLRISHILIFCLICYNHIHIKFVGLVFLPIYTIIASFCGWCGS